MRCGKNPQFIIFFEGFPNRTLQLDLIVISHMLHDFLPVTKVDVGNEIVDRIEVHGAKLTF